jgi:hypothetical protein
MRRSNGLRATLSNAMSIRVPDSKFGILLDDILRMIRRLLCVLVLRTYREGHVSKINKSGEALLF